MSRQSPTRRILAVLTVLVAILVGGLSAPASARGATQIAGTITSYDDCTELVSRRASVPRTENRRKSDGRFRI